MKKIKIRINWQSAENCLAADWELWNPKSKIANPKSDPPSPFFGVDPKKVPALSLGRSALWPIAWPPHPRPLSLKGRGVKELEEGGGSR